MLKIGSHGQAKPVEVGMMSMYEQGALWLTNITTSAREVGCRMKGTEQIAPAGGGRRETPTLSGCWEAGRAPTEASVATGLVKRDDN